MSVTKAYLKRIYRSMFLLGMCLVAVLLAMSYLASMIGDYEKDAAVSGSEGSSDGGITVSMPDNE